MNRSAAPGPVFPTLVYADVGAAAAWLCRTFGFTERFRYGPDAAPAGAQLAVGEGAGAGAVVLAAPREAGRSAAWYDQVAFRPPRPDEVTHAVGVRVADVDAHHERARRGGARVLHPPETYPFGERQYTAVDPGGHRWTFTQSVADVAPEGWGATPAGPR